MSHTEGKLTIDGFGNIKVEGGYFLRLYGSTLSTREEAEANARRLVACWNACEGISTDKLESVLMLGDTLKTRIDALREEADMSTKERDGLLKVLRELHEPGRGDLSDISLNMEIDSILSRYPEEE